MSDISTITMKVLFLKDDDIWWSALCLEHNIAAQGKTVGEAADELRRTIVGEVALHLSKGVKCLSLINSAPDKYWSMFEKVWTSTDHLAGGVQVKLREKEPHAPPDMPQYSVLVDFLPLADGTVPGRRSTTFLHRSDAT